MLQYQPYTVLLRIILCALCFTVSTTIATATVHYSNISNLTIGYETTEKKPSGDVELWYRVPGRKPWTIYNTFPKDKKEMSFLADKDGTYHFYTVALDAAGKREKRPNKRSMAQQTVTIDATPPRLRLLSPLGGIIEPGQFVNIQWTCRDDYLEEDGITIELSLPNGGWEPLIAHARSSRQSYRWNVAGSLEGQKRFLRISALDKAGNISSVETAVPIVFETATPEEDPKKEVVAEPKELVAGPELSNRRIFDINYHVGTLGPSGLAQVGLWYTTNEGASWNFYSYDADLQSPIQFSAPGEGVYGFFIELSNRAGATSGKPLSGNKPNLRTVVDYTPPSVLLTSPRSGNFLKGGDETTITWKAHDNSLASNPVTLFVSEDAGHSWKTLVQHIQNTGSWNWKLPAINSDSYRIKIEVSDLAGNVGSASTSGNIILDATTPQGNISTITPLTKATYLPGDSSALQSTTTPITTTKDLQEERLFKLATIWRNRGNYRKALEYYDLLEERYNADERFINDVAITYFKARAYSKSLELFTALAQDYEKNPVYQYHIGVIHFYRERYAEALHYFKKALVLNESDENSHWYIAKIYYLKEDIPSALLEWKKIVVINKPNSILREQSLRLIKKYRSK